ncbi:TPA: hypothetical protein HA251_07360 [Candidatus Woesearchaeota archaeon]|nr:hypothetical protein [Candidatus Woesearchaeota archaeon]
MHRKDRAAARPKTFKEFCALFTDEELSSIVKIGRRYYHDPEKLIDYAKERRMDPFSVGLYLGEERHDFLPTSALIDLLAPHAQHRVAVGERAAWLYLCGRDILMDGVAQPGEHAEGTIVMVEDTHGNTIGVGRVTSRFELKMRNKVYIKHMLDKGEYLRRER